MSFLRNRDNRFPLEASVFVPGSICNSEVDWISVLIAEVGWRTVTIGFHRMLVMTGTGFPHSRHCSRPSGLAVPQEEQYTGVRIAPQLIQYLVSGSLAFPQDGHLTNVPAIIFFTICAGFDLTVRQVFRTRTLAF